MNEDDLKYPDALHSRLVNCLQTILDYEADLEAMRFGKELLQDFGNLRVFMAQLSAMAPNEEDVCRIERATAALLAELKRPLAQTAGGGPREPLQ